MKQEGAGQGERGLRQAIADASAGGNVEVGVEYVISHPTQVGCPDGWRHRSTAVSQHDYAAA